MSTGKYGQHIIDVIADFTKSRTNLNVSYDGSKSTSIKSLEAELYGIGKRHGEIFREEYARATPQLGNTNLASIEYTRKSGEEFTINAIRSDYKSLITLRKFAERSDDWRAVRTVYNYIAPIGLGTFTTTKDDKFLVSYRSEKQDVPNRIINSWVGNLDQLGSEKMPTVSERIAERAGVKLGLGSDDYVLGDPVGIFMDRTASHNPYVVFKASLPELTHNDVVEMNKEAQMRSAFADKIVVGVDLDERKAGEHIESEASSYVGNGLAAVLYGLKGIFGDAWFEDQVSKIGSKAHINRNNVFYHKMKFRPSMIERV